ncbi:MAG: glycoside hydrolase family 3 C-terminal domain-containing protein, partial [bacterium]
MVPYHSIPDEELDSPEHRDLALKAAHKAIVLLKNKGILPLDKNKVKSIAVIGPNAAECQLGIYSGWPNIQVSPLEGIKHQASQYGIKVHYTKGCDIGGGLLRPIPAHYFSLIEGTGHTGMRGEYFDNMDLRGEPVFTRIDSSIDFTWGVRSPGPGMPEDQFSVRWTGKIIPPVTRTYHLGTRTDDGSRLYVDGKLLFQDWTEHGEKPNSGEIKLRAGEEYEIVFEYFDNGMGATARLTWDLGQKEFNQAKKAAQDNDLVILVLGVTPGIASEELDRTTINLPQIQHQLIREIREVNSNIIIVLINGGPLALAESEDYAA